MITSDKAPPLPHEALLQYCRINAVYRRCRRCFDSIWVVTTIYIPDCLYCYDGYGPSFVINRLSRGLHNEPRQAGSGAALAELGAHHTVS